MPLALKTTWVHRPDRVTDDTHDTHALNTPPVPYPYLNSLPHAPLRGSFHLIGTIKMQLETQIRCCSASQIVQRRASTRSPYHDFLLHRCAMSSPYSFPFFCHVRREVGQHLIHAERPLHLFVNNLFGSLYPE